MAASTQAILLLKGLEGNAGMAATLGITSATLTPDIAARINMALLSW